MPHVLCVAWCTAGSHCGVLIIPTYLATATVFISSQSLTSEMVPRLLR